MLNQYYLNHNEIEHYQYMLDKGYKSYNAVIGGQLYIIFQVVDKDYIGIAWPSVSGRLDGVPIGDTFLMSCQSLQDLILPQLPDSFKVLLFPRFS